MAEFNHLVSFSLVFLAVVVAVFAGHAHGADICLKAPYVPLCRSVVKGRTNPIVAMQVAIEQLLIETKRNRLSSVKLGKMQSLDSCNENFDSAIDDLQNSIQYLKSKDKASLNSSLSTAITYYVTCDDAVAEGGIMQLASKILSKDTILRHMASNCLYLSTLLH